MAGRGKLSIVGTDPDDTARISSRADFLAFVSALRDDLHNNASHWENPTLATFLEALEAWGSSCPNYYRNMEIPLNPDEPQWRVFADMLAAARVYE
jgi:hypothetical protein